MAFCPTPGGGVAVCFANPATQPTGSITSSWHLFQTIYNSIVPTVVGSVNGIINSLAGLVGTPLKVAISTWLAGMMLMHVFGPEGNPLTKLEKELMACAVAFVIATTPSTYALFFTNTLLTALPNDIGNAIAGAFGAVAVSAGAFDTLWNKALAAGWTIFQNLGWSITDAMMGLLVLIYWLVSLGAIGYGFVIWMISFVVLALFIATGPLFVALLAFPFFRPIFASWLGAALQCVILQAFTVALLAMLTGAEGITIGSIAAQSGTNTAMAVQTLIGGGALFVFGAWVIKHLPGAASAISAGLTFHAPQIVSGAMSAARGASSAWGAATAAAPPPPAAANTNASASASVAPPGRSLSAST
jgi:type IV secretion system protein VirB6